MSEAKDSSAQQPLYEKYVNPQWVRLLDVLGMNVHYASCLGSELFTDDGRRILDFSSGSEGVEAVIKFARAYTKRPGILYAGGGFHGLTCGALSLMDNPFWTAEFGPLLPETQAVPFGDLEQL